LGLLELSDHKHLYWAEYGDPTGAPVFVFHGNPGSRLAWGAMPRSPFLPGVRLVAPDRPGYGRTDFKPKALERWPQDMVELADHLGIEKFAIFAPSGGAPYALACAWKIPDRLTAVGVFGAVGPNAPEAVEGVLPSLQLLWRIAKPLRWAVRVQMWLMSLLARRNPARFAEKLGALELKDEDQAVFDRTDTRELFCIDFPEAYRQNGVGSAYDATIPANWPIPLDEIQMKVLLWHAERDPLVGNMTPYLASHLPKQNCADFPERGIYGSSTTCRRYSRLF
jgi:pimeloyl-ACP methyl ester carboxylesterase